MCCVTRAPERAGTSPLDAEKRPGVSCARAAAWPLFHLRDEIRQRQRMAEFFTTIRAPFATTTDRKLSWNAPNIIAVRCGGHHGHIFDDGPEPTGLRYCTSAVAPALHTQGAGAETGLNRPQNRRSQSRLSLIYRRGGCVAPSMRCRSAKVQKYRSDCEHRVSHVRAHRLCGRLAVPSSGSSALRNPGVIMPHTAIPMRSRCLKRCRLAAQIGTSHNATSRHHRDHEGRR